MSVTGKRRFRNIVEEAIALKVSIEPITAKTFRSDAAAILESLIGEFDENIVLKAMKHQGFEADAYRSSTKALGIIARERRNLRRKNPHRLSDAVRQALSVLRSIFFKAGHQAAI